MQTHRIKNRINQIDKSADCIVINQSFPNEGKLRTNRYRKCVIQVIFVDICGFTKFCKDVSEDKEKGIVIRTFHEGISDIFSSFKIKNVDIQGDGIFCTTSKKNNKVFECAVNINNYLKDFWSKKVKKRIKKKLDYKISIVSEEELILIAGKNTQKKLIYCGGAVNIAKKINEKLNEKNCIILNGKFKEKLNEKYQSKMERISCEYEIIGECWKSNYDTEDHEKW